MVKGILRLPQGSISAVIHSLYSIRSIISQEKIKGYYGLVEQAAAIVKAWQKKGYKKNYEDDICMKCVGNEKKEKNFQTVLET